MEYYYLAFVPAGNGAHDIYSADFPELAERAENLHQAMEVAEAALNRAAARRREQGMELPAPCVQTEAERLVGERLRNSCGEVPEDIFYHLVPLGKDGNESVFETLFAPHL